jgi:hypothetical protein
MPFDVLAERLFLKNSRGDKTAVELFQRDLTGGPSNIAWLPKGIPMDTINSSVQGAAVSAERAEPT